MKDAGGGLGTTIGDAGLDFEFVFVVVVVLALVAFDFSRAVGVWWFGVDVPADVVFDLVFLFGVAVVMGESTSS